MLDLVSAALPAGLLPFEFVPSLLLTAPDYLSLSLGTPYVSLEFCEPQTSVLAPLGHQLFLLIILHHLAQTARSQSSR